MSCVLYDHFRDGVQRRWLPYEGHRDAFSFSIYAVPYKLNDSLSGISLVGDSPNMIVACFQH
jgi:hypothetical protein